MKKWVTPLLTLALLACDKSTPEKSTKALAASDFEHYDGWVGDLPLAALSKEKAHSGLYSTVVRPGQDYSLGYNNQLGKLSPSRISKVKVHGWVFLPNDKANALLVTQLIDPGTSKSLVWDGLDLVKEVKKYNEWVEVNKTVAFPPEATYMSRLAVYLWRGPSTQPVYLDDLAIERVD